MSYGHLLKTQANDVLNAVRESGLDPEDFIWELEPDGRPDPFLESHPREWVDRSGAAYNGGGPTLSWNPTHGSGWIVQVRPTTEAARPFGYLSLLAPRGREAKRELRVRSYVGWA